MDQTPKGIDKMTKKVLLAIPQLTGGGAERVVSVWANELSHRGYDTSILVFGRTKDEYHTHQNVKIYAVASDLEEYKAMPYSIRFRIMRSLVKQIRPYYIISFLPSMQVWMMLASIGLGIKRIETIRINPWRINVTNPLHTFLWKLCYRTSDKIILQASDQGSFFSQRDQKKSILIPNPISELYVNNYKETFSQVPTEFIAAGRIDPQKNYKMMIRAFAQVCSENQNLHLRIFGTGSEAYTAELENYIKELDMENHIFLMGRSPNMEEEYKKSDIYLMTSDYEGLPNALAEAMISQLICISTDCKTGPKDLIDDGVNGYLVPVNDAAALAGAIKQVLHMSYIEREQMAVAAREKVMRYCSHENSINALCKLLK
jgi:glycosyltransferase involved in cell wall biosynthesis